MSRNTEKAAVKAFLDLENGSLGAKTCLTCRDALCDTEYLHQNPLQNPRFFIARADDRFSILILNRYPGHQKDEASPSFAM